MDYDESREGSSGISGNVPIRTPSMHVSLEYEGYRNPDQILTELLGAAFGIEAQGVRCTSYRNDSENFTLRLGFSGQDRDKQTAALNAAWFKVGQVVGAVNTLGKPPTVSKDGNGLLTMNCNFDQMLELIMSAEKIIDPQKLADIKANKAAKGAAKV